MDSDSENEEIFLRNVKDDIDKLAKKMLEPKLIKSAKNN